MTVPKPRQVPQGLGGHHVAEQRAHGALDLSASAADVAGDGSGAWLTAGALAGLAHDRGVDLDVTVGAEDDVLEVHLDAQQRVLAALLAGSRAAAALTAAAEEGLEDVAEACEAAVEPAHTAAAAAVVVVLALTGVAQHVVGVGDVLEPLSGVGT